MTRLNPTEQDELITALARASEQYMRGIDAVRDDAGEIANYAKVASIRTVCGISAGLWQNVKDRMLRLHIPIARSHRGHYLGHEGEQATLLASQYKQVKPRLDRMATNYATAGFAGELPAMVAFAREHLGIDLVTLPELISAITRSLFDAVRKELGDGETDDDD